MNMEPLMASLFKTELPCKWEHANVLAVFSKLVFITVVNEVKSVYGTPE